MHRRCFLIDSAAWLSAPSALSTAHVAPPRKQPAAETGFQRWLSRGNALDDPLVGPFGGGSLGDATHG